MSIDASKLAEQVKLAYDFIDALHSQALALIKDVELQLGETSREAGAQLAALRPGNNYQFATNSMSKAMDMPRPVVTNYYAAFFKVGSGRAKQSPADGRTPMAFVKVVLRERDLDHPEVRFGVVSELTRGSQRAKAGPQTIEQLAMRIAESVLDSRSLTGSKQYEVEYSDSSLRCHVSGRAVRLADLPDSEAVAHKVVEPLLEMFAEVAPANSPGGR